MISLRYRSVRDAVASYAADVREFEAACYRVTDRLRLVHGSDYELEWGTLVLLLAWDAKLELLLRRCADDLLTPPPAQLRDSLARLRASWTTYLARFREELAAILVAQVERSILSRMRVVAGAPLSLVSIEDLEVFLDERDTIELCCEGAERYFPDEPIRERVERADEGVKTCILHHVRPNLLREYELEALESLNVTWVPPSYWWRHIEWTGVASR